MPKLSLIAATLLCLWLLPVTTASAAPFCVKETGAPDECWYYDIRACKAEAAKRKADCSANPDEMRTMANKGPFCLVDSSMIPTCIFKTSENCYQEAQLRNAVCFENFAVTDESDTQLAAEDMNDIQVIDNAAAISETELLDSFGDLSPEGFQMDNDVLDPFIGRPDYP